MFYKHLIFLLLLAIALFSSPALASTSANKIYEVDFDNLPLSMRKQVQCLADNIYHEARSEPTSGQLAVALVTMNRVHNDAFPSTVCEVVREKRRSNKTGKMVCQFSWYCVVGLRTNRSRESYAEALDNAIKVYINYALLKDVTKGALFYHANYVNPRWYKLKRTVAIGRHIFYKEG